VLASLFRVIFTSRFLITDIWSLISDI